jgi:ABC-type glycerol-3-phosphate transport system permease component
MTIDGRSAMVRVLGWVGYVLFFAFGLLTLLPIAWMVSTSLKPLSESLAWPIVWIPSPPLWGNYTSALSHFNFARYAFNSLFVAVMDTILTVTLAALAGYSLAKFRYFGQRIIFLAILSTLMLPLEAVMVPTFLVVKDLGWLNTYQGLIIPQLASAFGVFLMRQFMLRIPDSVIEAARIDGAGELRTFFAIILPMSTPALMTLSIFAFRESWDSFVWPYLVTSRDEFRTLPLGLQVFQQQYITNYPEIMAVSTIAFIPLVVMFFLFQRGFMQGFGSLSGSHGE